MKKAFLVFSALAVVAVFTGCGSNANLVPQCSKAVVSADAVTGGNCI
jgi:predicted small lipoprotein YifL